MNRSRQVATQSEIPRRVTRSMISTVRLSAKEKQSCLVQHSKKISAKAEKSKKRKLELDHDQENWSEGERIMSKIKKYRKENKALEAKLDIVEKRSAARAKELDNEIMKVADKSLSIKMEIKSCRDEFSLKYEPVQTETEKKTKELESLKKKVAAQTTELEKAIDQIDTLQKVGPVTVDSFEYEDFQYLMEINSANHQKHSKALKRLAELEKIVARMHNS